MIDFKELLHTAAKSFPSQKALAKAIGITPERLSRAIKGDYPLNVLNCLRLATITQTHPSAILRAANKGEVADLIERLYGEVDSTITLEEREHLDRWRKTTPAKKQAIEVLTLPD